MKIVFQLPLLLLVGGHISQLGLLSQDAVSCLGNKYFFSHSSGGWDSESRVPVWLGFGESSLMAFGWALSHCVFTWQS